MRIVLLVIATILVLLFLIHLIRGRQYDNMFVNLVGDDYTLSELYGVGMVWQRMIPSLDYRSSVGMKVGKSVGFLYEREYVEYYSRVILAKAYTFAHVGTCFSFLLGLILFDDSTSIILALAGTAISMFLAIQVTNEPAKKVQNIADELVMALPNMTTKLALLVDSGMTLREGWMYVAERTGGELGRYMKVSCKEMKNGITTKDAIYNFGNATTSKDIKKLVSIIIVGMEQGSKNLSSLLIQQSNELWSLKRQKMLQKGEEAATKLLVPTMMMFVGIIIVIVVSSMGEMSI